MSYVRLYLAVVGRRRRERSPSASKVCGSAHRAARTRAGLQATAGLVGAQNVIPHAKNRGGDADRRVWAARSGGGGRAGDSRVATKGRMAPTQRTAEIFPKMRVEISGRGIYSSFLLFSPKSPAGGLFRSAIHRPLPVYIARCSPPDISTLRRGDKRPRCSPTRIRLRNPWPSSSPATGAFRKRFAVDSPARPLLTPSCAVQSVPTVRR